MTEIAVAINDSCATEMVNRPKRRWASRKTITVVVVAIILVVCSPGFLRYRAVQNIKNSGGLVAFIPVLPGEEKLPGWIGRRIPDAWVKESWPAFFGKPSYVSLGAPDQIPRRALDAMVQIGDIDVVTLAGGDLTDEDLAILAQMNSIKYLSIFNKSITDKGLEHLSSLSSLEYLSVIGSQVTDSGVERLQQALPMCDIRTEYEQTGP